MPPKILLDCDPGHDDLIAIFVAAAYADLLGITTVAGNAPLDRTTYNACVARDWLGLDVPVHSGAARPLVAEPKYGAYVHGESGLDGAPLPTPARLADSPDAVAFIVETARAHPGLTLVPTGPLTNIALALRAAPDLAAHVSRISLMGGGTFGNRTPAAEFNIWADPEAAEIVYTAGIPITMAGLDATHQFLVDAARIDQIDALPGHLADVLADLLRFFAHNYMDRHYEMPGAALHDPLAVLAVTHPEVVTTVARHVAVETAGAHAVGQTIVDRRGIRDHAGANVDVIEHVDSEAAWQLTFAAIEQAVARSEADE